MFIDLEMLSREERRGELKIMKNEEHEHRIQSIKTEYKVEIGDTDWFQSGSLRFLTYLPPTPLNIDFSYVKMIMDVRIVKRFFFFDISKDNILTDFIPKTKLRSI